MATRPSLEMELLDALARILQSTGVEPQTMAKHFTQICARLTKRPTPSFRQHLPDLPQIISEWYRNPAYLNRQGAPRPLPRAGPISLESLARATLPAALPSASIAALQYNLAIRRTRGGFIPTGQRIVFVDDDRRAHALDALRALLGTLERNVAAPRTAFRLFECIGSHPDVPRTELKGFDTRVRPLALDFLQRSYADLTRLARHSNPKTPAARLGVGVYVFEDRTAHPRTRRRAR